MKNRKIQNFHHKISQSCCQVSCWAQEEEPSLTVVFTNLLTLPLMETHIQKDTHPSNTVTKMNHCHDGCKETPPRFSIGSWSRLELLFDLLCRLTGSTEVTGVMCALEKLSIYHFYKLDSLLSNDEWTVTVHICWHWWANFMMLSERPSHLYNALWKITSLWYFISDINVQLKSYLVCAAMVWANITLLQCSSHHWVTIHILLWTGHLKADGVDAAIWVTSCVTLSYNIPFNGFTQDAFYSSVVHQSGQCCCYWKYTLMQWWTDLSSFKGKSVFGAGGPVCSWWELPSALSPDISWWCHESKSKAVSHHCIVKSSLLLQWRVVLFSINNDVFIGRPESTWGQDLLVITSKRWWVLHMTSVKQSCAFEHFRHIWSILQ